MKLTLYISGGITGLSKEHTIDIDSLDEETRQSVINYFSKTHLSNREVNLSETWSLNDEKEIQISRHELPPELIDLYTEMKRNVHYRKK